LVTNVILAARRERRACLFLEGAAKEMTSTTNAAKRKKGKKRHSFVAAEGKEGFAAVRSGGERKREPRSCIVALERGSDSYLLYGQARRAKEAMRTHRVKRGGGEKTS